jgi:nicotine blue oxidoreductase
LVAWALEHIGAAGLDEIFVVVGPVELRDMLGTEVVVHNPDWASGLASSLHAGVAEAERRGHDVVVVGLGDQPLVPPSAWSAPPTARSPWLASPIIPPHRSGLRATCGPCSRARVTSALVN